MSRILDQNGDGYGPTLQLVEEVGCPAQRKLIFRCSCGGFEGFPHAVVVPQHTRIEGTMDIVLLHQLADTLAPAHRVAFGFDFNDLKRFSQPFELEGVAFG